MKSGAPDSGEHTNAVGRQDLPALGERMITDQIVDHVITLIGPGKIFLGVIDHVINSDRADKIDIARAANAGHFCAERFRDLHRESANASGRAVDQNFLSGLNVPLVPETLQRCDSGDSDRAGWLERNVDRFQHDRAIRLDANVIRHRSVLRSENFFARFEVHYIFSNCLYDTGEISSESGVLGLAHPGHWTHRPRASDQVSIDRIDRGRADADENFVVVRRGLFKLAELKILDAVFAIHDSFHGITRGSSVAIAVVSGTPVSDEAEQETDEQQNQDNAERPLEKSFHLLLSVIDY